MTLGEKIKRERKKRKLTQSDLANGRITRNMVSLIEKDLANPSLETLRHISARLELPLTFLVSDADDTFFYAKKEALSGILAAYNSKNYSVAVSRIEKLEQTDDELSLILADSHLEIGKKLLSGGSLLSAEKHFAKALDYCATCCYDTSRISALSNMYLSVARNIQAPLLEFDTDAFSAATIHSFDIEFYKYLTLDFDFPYTNSVYSNHLEAKKLIREKNYVNAVKILEEIGSAKRSADYNAYVVFGVYSDLESCYKQLFDFEMAYKYSSKRFSLLEGFKS